MYGIATPITIKPILCTTGALENFILYIFMFTIQLSIQLSVPNW